MSTYSVEDLQKAVGFMTHAQKPCIFSGAGLSRASGLPTYRGDDGLWDTGDNMRFSHGDTYKENPKAFMRFWKDRMAQFDGVGPHAAHHALQLLQSLKPETTLVTQNVDGLLQDAGCQNVLELHGSLRRTRCGNCEAKGPFLFGRCLRCFGFARPDVVLFGESLNRDTLDLALRSATRCDLLIAVGTSAVVFPAAELPHRAQAFGIPVLVIDPDPPQELASAARIILRGKAEELLPVLVERSFEL